MSERPIIFGAESVRAILAGRKTQTRRVIKDAAALVKSTPYRTSTFFWVRETWLEFDRDHWESPSLPKDVLSSRYGAPRRNSCAYRADTTPAGEEARADYGYKWRSPIFMPRWASRLTLRITDVRVQRLQDISDEDARAEGQGITWGAGCFHRSFSGGWDALNAKRGFSWSSNPRVWAVTFERVAA